MKLCGIIAEFNPLTNGHEYLIRKVKEKTNLPIAVILSGDIVQRGELPILSKFERATLAIKAGASMVIELPAIYCLSSAQNFASGAIKYLSALGVTHLAFGVETDPQTIMDFAKMRNDEPQEISGAIRREIKNGSSYSTAIYKAYTSETSQKFEEVFKSANNILAAEYLRAIYRHKLKIEPVFVRRTDNGYSSPKTKTIKEKGKKTTFASASLVRKLLSEGKDVSSLVPAYCLEKLKAPSPRQDDRLSAILIEKIRSVKQSDLTAYYDIDSPLASAIFKASNKFATIDDVVKASASKCHRESRIKKDLFVPHLNLSKEKFKFLNSRLCALNVLAIDKDFRFEIKTIKAQCKYPLVVSQKDISALSEKNNGIVKLNQQVSDLFALATLRAKTTDKTIFV